MGISPVEMEKVLGHSPQVLVVGKSNAAAKASVHLAEEGFLPEDITIAYTTDEAADVLKKKISDAIFMDQELMGDDVAQILGTESPVIAFEERFLETSEERSSTVFDKILEIIKPQTVFQASFC